MTKEEKTAWAKILNQTTGLEPEQEIKTRAAIQEIVGVLTWASMQPGLSDEGIRINNALKTAEYIEEGFTRICVHNQKLGAIIEEMQKDYV